MISIKEGVIAPKIRLVPDDAYPVELTSIINHAKQRCLSSLFIVDISPGVNQDQLVDSMLLSLKAAIWRGVEVRLLIGGSRSNHEIAKIGLAARLRAGQLKIPCRLMAGRKVRGSHIKMVIADNLILAGSHNWSTGAFTNQTQDSILIKSQDLAASMVSLFEYQWNRAGVGGEDGDL